MHGYLSESDFRRLIDEVFTPFLSELGFGLSEYKITSIWRFAEFGGHGLAIKVMYEFPMHYADVKLQTASDRWISHTQPSTTLSISMLNERYMGVIGADAIAANDQCFSGIDFACPEASRLMVMAKQLRLILPVWMQDDRAD